MSKSIKILTWNVSYRGISGVRSGKQIYYSDWEDRNSQTVSDLNPLPCSRYAQQNICMENIMSYLQSTSDNYNIICLIEAVPELLDYDLGKIATIFHHPEASVETIIVWHDPKYKIREKYLCSVSPAGEASRLIGIIVFDDPPLILVVVHFPHPDEHSNVAKYIKPMLDLLVGKYADANRYNIIITGDFNTEMDCPGLNNPYTGQNTCYTIVDRKWRELPLSFEYDRFVHTDPVKPVRIETVDDPSELWSSGQYSDHLPIRGQFKINHSPTGIPLSLTIPYRLIKFDEFKLRFYRGSAARPLSERRGGSLPF